MAAEHPRPGDEHPRILAEARIITEAETIVEAVAEDTEAELDEEHDRALDDVRDACRRLERAIEAFVAARRDEG